MCTEAAYTISLKFILMVALMYTLWLANNQLSSRELLHQETKPNECSTNFDVPQNPSLSYDPKRCKD